MERFKQFYKQSICAVRAQILLLVLVLLLPMRMLANFSPQSGDIGGEGTGGWTPTDAGLVVQLKTNETFRLSTIIDGVEYFVCDYSGHTGGKFNYEPGDFLKLIPRNTDGTPPANSLWTVQVPVNRTVSNVSYKLVEGIDDIVYSMWSQANPNHTLTTTGNDYTIAGALTTSNNYNYTCDVAFAIPTVRARVNMDPKNTLGKRDGSQWAFDGQKGVDAKGEVWREVYWFYKSKINAPYSFANTGLIAFDTSNGKAYQINGKSSGESKKRMLFRMYIVEDHPFESCPNTYFFAHNEQNFLKFVKFTSLPILTTDSTNARKIYTHDHLHCMEREGDTKYYKSDLYQIPEKDSTYFYVGKNDQFYRSAEGEPLGTTSGAYSEFRKIRDMRISHLANESTPYIAPAGALGRIVVDTTSGAENLGATFEPAGYFLRTNTGVNVQMHKQADGTWLSEEMWTITPYYAGLTIKTLLFTGSEYSPSDPGVEISGWSGEVYGTAVPVSDGTIIVGKSGWPKIDPSNPATNGGMVFILADATECIRYDNNGFLGVELPIQYVKDGEHTLTIRNARLKEGFTFLGWNTAADGSGTSYAVGDTYTFSKADTVTLYAQATYDGVYNIALSFIHPTNGKRYFLSHPGTNASPRYARALHYDDWTNVRQGLSNDMNNDPNHVTTYHLFEDTVTRLPEERLFVLLQDTLHGYEDSLVFNEDYFSDEDYLGLYFTDPNTILANDGWVGLFKSTNGWPDYLHPVVNNTKLFSTHYNNVDGGTPTRQERLNSSAPYVQYNEGANQFDGVSDQASATSFQLSAITMADAHYVILPDTTDSETGWTESITFGYHESPMASRQVWSKLLGRQLMACMIVGEDTVYFHPNNDKLFETASQLRLSADFRLNQDFNYIRDARVESLGEAVATEDKPTMTEASNEYCRIVTSGESSPMNVQYQGNYIDIVDTLRVSLRPGGISKIKDYYGWWKTGAAGVHVRPDGSRYRDILVTTKTYHYGPTQTAVQLKPEFEFYDFPPLVDHSQTLNFLVVRETSRQLLDVDGTVIGTEILNTDTIDDVLDLSSATCTLAEGSSYFSIGTKTSTSITLTTLIENELHDKHDTLTVSKSVTVGGVPYDLSVRVPLMQTDLTGDYMVWSVVYDGRRYFVTAGSGGIQFRQYSSIVNSRLVRNNKELIIGSANAANNNNQYLTPWASDYNPDAAESDQLRFWTEYGVNKRLVVDGETLALATYDPSYEGPFTYLTFKYVDLRTNENGNVEELVRLRYGADKWLQFNGTGFVLVNDEEDGSVFSWTYLKSEYNLLNYGDYPSRDQEEFTYNSTRTGSIQTRYKAYKEYSILLDDQMVYVAKEADELDMADLIDKDKEWKTQYSITHVRDSRMATLSGLSISLDSATLVTTITQSGSSPKDVRVDGKYVNIVDTLDVVLSLQADAPSYHFKDKWSSFTSIDDAHLKIPLIRRTYHDVPFDSVVCMVDGEDYNYAFPNRLRDGVSEDSLHTFTLTTWRHQGTNTFNVYNEVAASTIDEDPVDLTSLMDLTSAAYAQVRLLDDHGKAPNWCRIVSKGSNTITVKCLSNGLRSPRIANLYIVYIVMVNGKMRFVDFHLTVSQASLFDYANNQHLVHSEGASGDTLKNGMQQVHENKRILYYYNPGNYGRDNQEVELPVRERGFYGWWRWYREGNDENGVDVGDTDVPDSVWSTPPQNAYSTYNFPFRVIGDSVWVDEEDHSKGKKLVTQGRYTVFRYPSKPYPKNDPPSKSPRVVPPIDKKTMTYVVDLGNYTDNLPLSTKQTEVNQIDTAKLDTMKIITEPTLSLREIFELHPWTEMAAQMENYKTGVAGPFRNDKYMEDHVVMAPVGNRLLLKTEQRYDYNHLQPRYDDKGNLLRAGHSESLLGYYMRDDNWSSMSSTPDEDGVSRQDTMIWCGGWDADCEWFTYNPATDTYTACTHKVTVDDDFLNVPAKGGTSGDSNDTVYYCLRSRSKATTSPAGEDVTVDGGFWFNICRYKIIYHEKAKYGPKLESKVNGVMKSLITNDEIEQDYEVLERLDFDYNKPGEEYTVYPHPLPWGDCSYGYSYPVGPEIPDNRQHNDFAPNFPGPGEYSLINRIKKTNDVGAWYQRNIEQHGGKENGYMIYCDGMSSSGQVAALSLKTHLCEGQKMYFSAYVGNSSNQTGKSNPNFTVSVQGSKNDGASWEDIASYMTGDIEPSNNWYQIFFPIDHEHAYDEFRVRIYNLASDFDGNDFIIDDMCVFATKPPLIAYQANTKCIEQNENDSIIHVVLRVDYQGFIDYSYNDADVYYTIEKMHIEKKAKDTYDTIYSFVPIIDHYLNEAIIPGVDSEPDTIYGYVHMPARNYVPTDEDSIFHNINELAERFEQSIEAHEAWEKTDRSTLEPELFRKGYIREVIEGIERPVLYIVHKAKMAADDKYTVRMSLGSEGLMNSQCAMTSNLKVTNRMVLMLNDDEQEEKQVDGICANATYEVSLRVKGTLIQDGTAPQAMNGSCKSDWLLYGDTLEATSEVRYGYKYKDIEKVVKDILRYDPAAGERNTNQFARNLSEVSRNEMLRVQTEQRVVLSDASLNPYTILSNLVNNGFLTLFESDVMVTVNTGDSVQYVAFPIVGTGTDNMKGQGMEVCPTPIIIKLKSKKEAGELPLIIGGLDRDSVQSLEPVVVLADAATANSQLVIPIDSINRMMGLEAIELISTNDPNFREGLDVLRFVPERQLPRDIDDYYINGNNLVLEPAPANHYVMRQGYNYTFLITMRMRVGGTTDADGCPIGTIPFTVAVVPDYLRWSPQNADNNKWNDRYNWIGIDDKNNNILHDEANFAPLATTKVIIPAQTSGMPYPELPDTTRLSKTDSVKQVGFKYNTCDAIRFLPDAAIFQQHRLVYNDAIIDMSIPQQKWALRSAPVTGMLSGDLFMAQSELSNEISPWEVGEFDAAGRSYKTGNASFWLSVYNREFVQKGNNDQVKDSVRTAAADWSKVTNAMTLSLPPAQGWAVYSRTKSGASAAVRLPKYDDAYYYFYASGDKTDMAEGDLRAMRDELAGGTAGKLAYHPDTVGTPRYTLTNGVASSSFVFGNPSMGFVDIWGFIADNDLAESFSYLNADGNYTTVTKATADASTDTISTRERYLPPMHAIVVTGSEGTSLNVKLDTCRIVTSATQIKRPLPAAAPERHRAPYVVRPKGIMTITAVNPVSPRCTSRLLVGQGYHDAVRPGEDAVLTTLNIDNFHMTNTPTTPFNIYSVQDGYGLCIDLRDSVVNIPLSFYMSDLPYDAVTNLWFTGVNSIDCDLVLYDELLGTEKKIHDGVCILIETPEKNHEVRYYIRRRGYKPQDPSEPVATSLDPITGTQTDARKIIRNGLVYIVREGHVYTMLGQKVR